MLIYSSLGSSFFGDFIKASFMCCFSFMGGDSSLSTSNNWNYLKLTYTKQVLARCAELSTESRNQEFNDDGFTTFLPQILFYYTIFCLHSELCKHPSLP